jgi:hypothetical protein
MSSSENAKRESRSALIFSLEGIMHAKQLNALRSIAKFRCFFVRIGLKKGNLPI